MMNVTYDCGIAPTFPSFLQIPDAVNITQAFIAVLAAAIGLPLNIFLLVVIIKYAELHQRSLFLSLQIIIIEILYHLTIPLTILVSTIYGHWIFGNVVCNISGMIHDAFAMFRFTMTFVLTVDRFISVFKPFFYNRHGGLVSWTLSAVMWLVTLIRVVLPLTGILDCFIYIPTFKTCTVFPGCSDSCKYFAAWSIGLIVLTGVVLPLILYAIIFYIIRKITRYHVSVQASVRKGQRRQSEVINETMKYRNVVNSRKKFVTASILLTSIIGTTPAFTLYMATIFYQQPNRVLFIVNMLVGRTSFNIIPVFDSIAFFRHQDIMRISSKLFKVMKRRVHPSARNRIPDRRRSIDSHLTISEPGHSVIQETSV